MSLQKCSNLNFKHNGDSMVQNFKGRVFDFQFIMYFILLNPKTIILNISIQDKTFL